MIESDITKLANECIELYNLTFPVDLYHLCRRLDIKVIETDLDSDGYFINRNGKLFILIKKNSYSSERKRFTFAHEIGHSLLHYKSPIIKANVNKSNFFRYSDQLGSIEKEANFFASELLCPVWHLQRKLPCQTIDLSFIEEISNFYQISLQAAAIKCVQNSKTQNETLVFFDDYGELKWFVSLDDSLEFKDLPRNIEDVKYFLENYYSKDLRIEDVKTIGYGTTFLASGIQAMY